MNELRNVSLPEGLCAKTEQKFGSRFGTLEQFLSSVMAELVRDEAATMDQREHEIIEQRLKALGYI